MYRFSFFFVLVVVSSFFVFFLLLEMSSFCLFLSSFTIHNITPCAHAIFILYVLMYCGYYIIVFDFIFRVLFFFILFHFWVLMHFNIRSLANRNTLNELPSRSLNLRLLKKLPQKLKTLIEKFNNLVKS